MMIANGIQATKISAGALTQCVAYPTLPIWTKVTATQMAITIFRPDFKRAFSAAAAFLNTNGYDDYFKERDHPECHAILRSFTIVTIADFVRKAASARDICVNIAGIFPQCLNAPDY
jgi:hypothetical protein